MQSTRLLVLIPSRPYFKIAAFDNKLKTVAADILIFHRVKKNFKIDGIVITVNLSSRLKINDFVKWKNLLKATVAQTISFGHRPNH